MHKKLKAIQAAVFKDRFIVLLCSFFMVSGLISGFISQANEAALKALCVNIEGIFALLSELKYFLAIMICGAFPFTLPLSLVLLIIRGVSTAFSFRYYLFAGMKIIPLGLIFLIICACYVYMATKAVKHSYEAFRNINIPKTYKDVTRNSLPYMWSCAKIFGIILLGVALEVFIGV